VLYPDAGHAFLFQEGESFTYLVRTFLTGAPTPLNQSQIRQQYLVDYKTVTKAGTKYVSNLKSMTTSSSAQDLARIDVRYADAQGAFDDELLGYGASGKLGSNIQELVSANELIVRYVEAFSAQSGPKAKQWTTDVEKDGRVVLTDENALRHQLGLSPIVPKKTTTATSTTTTTIFY
jgi:hypothetical protein